MKPQYIKMEAFGSYVEETIRFDGIEQGLFLITGETGAGKTTIFDAIVFALYGESSGGKRDGKMMRSQYAPAGIRTRVTFGFLYGGEHYEITRVPEQPNYKKDKTTGEYVALKTSIKPSVELVLPDGTVYPGKIKEVDAKIVSLIGLNGAQFTQVAMLAQGDFMKLLLASSRERKEIFSKIFDTRIYGFIEDALAARYAAVRQELLENQEDIKRAFQQIRCVENSAFSEAWETEYGEHFCESDGEGLLKLAGQICRESQQKQDIFSKEKDTVETQLQTLLKKEEEAKRINGLFQQLREKQVEQKTLAGQLEMQKQISQKIVQGERAFELNGSYRTYLEWQQEQKKAKEQKEQLEKWIREQTPVRNQTEERWKKAQEAALRELPVLQVEEKRIEELLPQYTKREKLGKQIAEKKKDAAKREQQREAQEQKLKEAEEGARKREEALRNLQRERKDTKALQLQRENVQERIARLQEAVCREQRIQQIQKKWKAQERKLQTAMELEKQAMERYEETKTGFFRNQAAILRGELTEGDRCPVCGGVYHVDAVCTIEEESEKIVDKQIFQQREQEKNQAVKERENAKIEYEQIRQSYFHEYEVQKKDLQKLFGDLDGKFFVQAEEIREWKYDTAGEQAEQYAAERVHLLKEEQKKQEAAVQQLEQDCKKAETDQLCCERYERYIRIYQEKKPREEETLCQLRNACDQERILIAQLETEYKTIELPYANVAEAQEQLATIRQKSKKLAEEQKESQEQFQKQKEEMDKKRGEREQAEERWKQVSVTLESAKESFFQGLQRQGFVDYNAFLEALQQPDEMERLRSMQTSYQEQCIRVNEQIQALHQQTDGREPVDMEQYLTQKQALLQQKTEMEEKGNALYHLIVVNTDALEQGTKGYRKREKLLEKGQVLQKLSDTANGKTAGKHLNFQTYMQREFFKDMIQCANLRLYPMSGEQFSLQCRNLENLGKQGEVGLDLDIYSHATDQVRDVKTLSGGESFMAALSMALGMADMIQNSNGSVHIDTMFIDEGFGSLSEETRNQAIGILNDLSEGKRLVGIISHVSELKEQVDTKLVISKGSRGSHHRWQMDGTFL